MRTVYSDNAHIDVIAGQKREYPRHSPGAGADNVSIADGAGFGRSVKVQV